MGWRMTEKKDEIFLGDTDGVEGDFKGSESSVWSCGSGMLEFVLLVCGFYFLESVEARSEVGLVGNGNGGQYVNVVYVL